MDLSPQSPQDLWVACWKLLTRAQADKKHPYATPAVGSVDERGFPSSRVLVLRNCNEKEGYLEGYTDRRSAKVRHLATGPAQFSWLFWDPKKRLQLRARGGTTLLPAEESGQRFDQFPKHSRKAYATLSPPGSLLQTAGDGLPENWEQLDRQDTDYARDNFAIFRTTIEEADLLWLSRSSHRRVAASRRGDDWELHWVVP